MVKDNKRFKWFLKYFGIIGILNLFYLNLYLPLKLSFGQIFLIITQVVCVCEERGLDVSKISPHQLDEIIALSINSIKQIFTENGFRFFPNFIGPAFASSGVVPYKGLSKAEAFIEKDNHYISAVRTIFQANTLFGNVRECLDRLTIICRNFVYGLPNSGKFYIASKGMFLFLNLTNAQYTVFRYLVWTSSTLVQILYFPGPFHAKLPMIISSLIRDCHLQLFEIFEPIFEPLLQPLRGIIYKLPSISAAFRIKIAILLTCFQLQFDAFRLEHQKIIEFALSTYYSEAKKTTTGNNARWPLPEVSAEQFTNCLQNNRLDRQRFG